jgi:hypothetical protein
MVQAGVGKIGRREVAKVGPCKPLPPQASMSITNLLCYIRRDRLTSWKLDSLDRHERHPVLAYGSNDETFGKYAQRRNIIWVVGSQADGPPSLEAKIEIAGPLPEDTREYCYEVYGTIKGSCFFGLNDASRVMMKLVFQGERAWGLRDKSHTADWQNSLGIYFQAPRRIASVGVRAQRFRSPGAAPLEQLEKRIRSRTVFISWKHNDNDRKRCRFIRALSLELARLGFAVWWDRTALTNIEAIHDDYCELQKDNFMNRLLRQGLKESKAILAFWTNNYGRRSKGSIDNWTLNEWEAKGQLFRFALTADDFEHNRGMREPDRILRMPVNPQPEDAARVARDFQRKYDSIKI